MEDDIHELKPTLARIEECRRCGHFIVWEADLDDDGDMRGGYRVVPLSQCGDDERCGEKVGGRVIENLLELPRQARIGLANWLINERPRVTWKPLSETDAS